MKTFPWTNIKRFNFTWALPGGAWLETGKYQSSEGLKTEINWFSFSTIQHHLGQEWIDAQLSAQGWMTGCWIDCVPVIHREPLKPCAINGIPVNP